MIRKLRPGRIALLYGALGAGWILVSDLMLGRFLQPHSRLVAVGIVKGIVFVGLSALLIHYLVRRAARRVEREGLWHLGLFDRNPVPMAVYDAESLAFLAVNDAALRQYGYTREEALTQTVEAIRLREDLPGLRAAIAGMPEGALRQGLQMHVKRDGTRILVHIRAQAILFEGRRAILAAVEDVSGEQRAEEIRRAVVESSPLALIVTDLEGLVQSWNASAERIYGWRAADVLGKPMPDQSGTAETERRLLRERLGRGEVISGVEVQRTHRDGNPIHLRLFAAPLREGSGRVTGILSVVEDITERVRAEQSLQESETRYREMADNIEDVFYNFDARTGSVLYINPAYEKVWGRSLESVYANGMSYLEAVHPEDRARVVEAHESQLRGEARETEYRVVRPDGSVSWVLDRGIPILKDGAAERIVGIVRDITEGKRVLESLREGETRLAGLLANLPGMAYRCRLDRHWTMLFVSEGVIELTGYTQAELVDNAAVAFGDLVHPDDQERIYQEVMEGVRQDRAFELEYRIRAKSGEEKRVWERGRFFPDGAEGRLEGFIMDVTARRTVEEERERLLAAIEQMAEMMLITDARGAIQYVNPAFERVTGYMRAEVMGRNPRILKSGVQKTPYYEEMWRQLKAGKTWKGRMVNRRKDGKRFTQDSLISPIFDSSGAIVSYVAVNNDVTSQIALEEQFRQSQKMEAVGRLAGGIAHDFNNMLTVILIRSELARDGLPLDHPLRVSLAEIHDAAERSAALTRQLLTYARRQAVEPRVLVLNEAVGGTLQMLRRLMGENIELAWIPGGDLWPVKVDPVQIDQLLANLCVNARDAIADVGKVTIETANVTLDEEYCRTHHGHVPGEFVRLVVSDNGAGMDGETLSHLFEPFFTTKEMGKGTGLGLATVYGIVKQNDGFIDVYSEPGDGTAFKIYLPRHREKPEAAPALPATAPPLGRGETILLVEDESLILGVTVEILRNLGYNVLSAANPASALELAASHPGRIDLVLTDVVMPGMNGRELVERVVMSRPGTPSLYMSGYTANVLQHRGLADKSHFIQKPFKPQHLAAKVREVLDGETKASAPP